MIQTYSNNRKWKRIYNDEIEAKKEFKKKLLSHLRKGFIYLNPVAKWGEIRTQFSLEKSSYTGFMPIATREDRDDFFVIYMVGDFEDEILCHYNEDGKLLSKYSLGADRFSYRIMWGKDDKIYLNNLHQIESFSPAENKLEVIAERKDSFQSMLDLKGNHILWFSGTEIVVYDMVKQKYIWRRAVVCQKTDIVHTIYYLFQNDSSKIRKEEYKMDKYTEIRKIIEEAEEYVEFGEYVEEERISDIWIEKEEKRFYAKDFIEFLKKRILEID